MDNLAEDNISRVESSSNPDIVLSPSSVKQIERNLDTLEKISVAFLFYDDTTLSLQICEDVIKKRPISIFDNYIKENPAETWSMKLLECLYHVKNFFTFEKFGFTKFDASQFFDRNSSISRKRLILYKICESLTLNETNQIMNSLSNIPQEQYLEMFFLRIINDKDDWLKVHNALSCLNNEQVSQLITELECKDSISSESSFSFNGPQKDFFRDIGAYPIKDPENVGLCLIINEVDFQVLDKRLGSDKDVSALEETFREFKFDIKVFKNVLSTFFVKQLLEVITTSFKEVHSFLFLVILSHGSKGAIYCSDDKPVCIEVIMKLLSMVPNLKNIPKIIIIQACQGDQYLLSRKVGTDQVASLGSTVTDDADELRIRTMIIDYMSDVFLAMSTVPGYKSFRHTDIGTYFIQYFCQALKKYPYENFPDIITRVTKMVKEEVVKTKLEKYNFAQQPEYRSLLDRKLFLKIKRNDDCA